MNPSIQLRNLSIVALSLACFTVPIAPKVFGVVPTPDGGYPGGNTAEGQNALFSLTTGGFNTGVGFFALRANMAGRFNTAIGAGTLLANTADRNTAIGAGALLSNNTGVDNTAVGAFALLNNTVDANTAIGAGALFTNTNGISNSAIGVDALHANTSGSNNTAIGYGALIHNTSGGTNTALGVGACADVITAHNVICINRTGEDVSNTTWINNIFATTTPSGTTLPVIVSNASQLGTASSSRRVKKDIKPMEKASDAILALKPVTFHYKSDRTNVPQFGLIAEDVAAVNPGLVVRDERGEVYAVRYDAVNAMLLNEFLKEHKKVEQLESTIASLAATVKEQEAQIQKVSAQFKLSKSAPQTVLNNR